MSKQLNLFAEEISINDIVDFVHSMGKWQDESCYKTIVWKDNDFVLVCNQYLYGSKDERECCHDEVSLTEKNGFLKIDEICIYRMYLDLFNKYPFVFNKEYYEEYLIKYDK